MQGKLKRKATTAKAVKAPVVLANEQLVAQIQDGTYSNATLNNNPELQAEMANKIDEAALADATVLKYVSIQGHFLKFLQKNYPESVKKDIDGQLIPSKPLTRQEMLTFIGSMVFNKNGSLKIHDTIRGYLAAVKDLYNNLEFRVNQKRLDYNVAVNHAKSIKIDPELSVRMNKFSGAYATIVTKLCKGM